MPPDSGWTAPAEPTSSTRRSRGPVPYDEWETMPPAEREGRLGERLVTLVERAWREVPSLRRRLEAADLSPETCREIADLNRLAPVDRDWLIAQQHDHPPFGGWLLVPTERLRAVHLLPGPLRVPESAERDYWRWSAALAAAGVERGSLVIVEHSTRQRMGPMIETGVAAREAVAVSVDPLDSAALETFGPWASEAAFVGTARGLEILLARITPGVLRTAIITAGPISRSLAMHARRRHLEFFRAFGTAELGCVAFECRPGSEMHTVADLFVQILDAETGDPRPDGEPGTVAVSRLDEAYPHLRFATAARAARSHETCLCGRTTPRLVQFAES